MTRIPESIEEAIAGSLLGRVRLRYYEAITGSRHVLPTIAAALAHIRACYRRSLVLGELAEALLFGPTYIGSWADVPDLPEVDSLLGQLEDRGWVRSRVLEIAGCPDSMPDRILVVADSVGLRPAGRLYVVTLIDDRFPQGVALRAEIRASRAHPEPGVVVARGAEFVVVSQADALADPLLALAFRGLATLVGARDADSVRTVALDAPELQHLRLDPGPGGGPPRDPECLTRIQGVLTGGTCTEARVPLSAVRPFSYEYAFHYPRATTAIAERELRAGAEPQILVYWDGRSYVASDDYAELLAYQALGRREVPVVVLGHVEPGVGTVGRTGGRELLPGIRYLPGGGRGEPDAVSEWMADAVRESRRPSRALIELHLLYVRLVELLELPGVLERELHEFLVAHPVAFDAYGDRVLSEVRLGEDYRADLIVEYATSERQLLLVELERADLPLFTRTGRLRAPIQHARQQVEDWFRWWREHPAEIPASLDGTLPLHGVVVAGRSARLSEDDRRRLAHLNEGQRVKVITYDDLLERLERLIHAISEREAAA